MTDETTRNIESWDSLLNGLSERKSIGIEVGVFEGRSSIWFLQNPLAHPDSRLIAIDPFPQFEKYSHSDLIARFATNVGRLLTKVELHITSSSDALRELHGKYRDTADFVYIDGRHEATYVLEDAVLSWSLLKPGGILIIDDYELVNPGTYRLDAMPELARMVESANGDASVISSARGVDAFLDGYKGRWAMLDSSYQVAIRKVW